jgi:branched-chain amino acid transport system permease protein
MATARGLIRDSITPTGLILMVTVLAALIGLFGGPVLTRVAVVALVNVVIVVGIYIFVGTSGVLSFGHIGFMAVGAYAGAILTIPHAQRSILLPSLPAFLQTPTLPTLPAIIISAVVAAVVAFAVAIPLVRLAGLLAGMATFALLQIVYVVTNNWSEATGGTAGVLGIPLDTTIASAAIAAALAILVAYLFQRSAVGLRLQASREDEIAAAALGISVFRERLAAFVLSAAVVAVGGFLYGHFFGTISPTSFYVPATFATLSMLVIGGIRSLSGAVIGVLIVSALSEALVRVEAVTAVSALRELTMSLVTLAILILRPGGLTAGREIGDLWRRGRTRPPTITTGSTDTFESSPKE